MEEENPQMPVEEGQPDTQSIEMSLHLQQLLQAFNNPRISNLATHNPNEQLALLKTIADKASNIEARIEELSLFCEKYLKATQNKPHSTSNSRHSAMEVMEQQPNEPEKPIMVVRPVVRTETSEVSEIRHVINKLKVLLYKVKGQESTEFQYFYETYASKLKAIIDCSKIERCLDLDEGIVFYLRKIKQSFSTVDVRLIQMYKAHPTPHPKLLEKNYLAESVLLYVHLAAEQLLFHGGDPLNVEGSLLYCPIILEGNSLGISSWYLEQLTKHNSNWRQYTITLSFFYKQPQSSQGERISLSRLQKQQLIKQVCYSSVTAEENLKMLFTHDLGSKNKELIQRLCEIRIYLYQFLFFNWLREIVAFPERIEPPTTIQIHIEGDFYAELKEEFTEDSFPRERPDQLLELFMLPLRTGQHTNSKPIVKDEFKMQLQSMLFRQLAEETGFKATDPEIAGSAGRFFYDRRSRSRCDVKKFIKTF